MSARSQNAQGVAKGRKRAICFFSALVLELRILDSSSSTTRTSGWTGNSTGGHSPTRRLPRLLSRGCRYADLLAAKDPGLAVHDFLELLVDRLTLRRGQPRGLAGS